MITLEQKMKLSTEEMIGLAQRENNKKRGYLLVNRFQAKHVPVQPQKALSLFQMLGEEIYPHCIGEKVTFIGFAETATAIGARISIGFPGDSYYLHTTREAINKQYQVVNFQEEHSHATQQMLFCSHQEKMLKKANRIIFIEDEITTGKTILNFVNALKRKGIHGNFSAASIVNSMKRENREQFEQEGIELYYLVRLDNTFDDHKFDHTIVREKHGSLQNISVQYQEISGKLDPRIGVSAKKYEKACCSFAAQICEKVNDLFRKKVLVLGTEEFMYPAIYTAKVLEEQYHCTVKTHSTTRSPILPSNHADYPLKNRVQLCSVYENDRITYLYNLEQYDEVILLTDASQVTKKGIHNLASSLQGYGCNHLMVFRWVES